MPDELKTYFEDPKNYADLTDIVKKIHVFYDSNKAILKIAVNILWFKKNQFYFIQSFNPAAIRRIKVLSDIYISDSKQKAVLLQRQEEAKVNFYFVVMIILRLFSAHSKAITMNRLLTLKYLRLAPN